MSKSLGLALTLAGLGMATYAWTPGATDQAANEQLASVVRITTETAHAAQADSGPASQTRPRGPGDEAGARPTRDMMASRVASSPPATSRPAAPDFQRITSATPGDDAARQTLTSSIQTELKRVGCYEGEADGTWSPATRRAMQAFIERVNASLPVREPDYILLTLLQGQDTQVCGKGCPAGQVALAEGRCEARAIVAKKNDVKQRLQQEAESKAGKQEARRVAALVREPGVRADKERPRQTVAAAAFVPPIEAQPPLPGSPPSRLGAPIELPLATPAAATPVPTVPAATAPVAAAPPANEGRTPAKQATRQAARQGTAQLRFVAPFAPPAGLTRAAPQRSAARAPGPSLRTAIFTDLSRNAP